MNSRQIQCFLEAGRTMNFTKAAENLTLPQPAVSRYIASLEEELGTALFRRENNRRIAFTEAGRVYFNLMQRFSQELQQTRRLFETQTPELRLGIQMGWNSDRFLPTVMARVRARVGEDLRLTLVCLESRPLLRALNEKKLDAILIFENYVSKEPELELQRFTSLQRLIVYSSRLPGAGSISSPADFYPWDFLIADDPRIREICRDTEDFFRPYHFVPRFVTVPNQDTVLTYVKNGMGVAILDEWYHDLHDPALRTLTINDHLPVALSWRRGSDSTAITVFREELTRFFSPKGKK